MPEAAYKGVLGYIHETQAELINTSLPFEGWGIWSCEILWPNSSVLQKWQALHCNINQLPIWVFSKSSYWGFIIGHFSYLDLTSPKECWNYEHKFSGISWNPIKQTLFRQVSLRVKQKQARL